MGLFGHKTEPKVPLTYDVMMKCKCATCPVQADSTCTKSKIKARDEMMQNMIGNVMTPGNLSAHLSKLENAGYVEVTKEFIERKPHTALALTKKGRNAFKQYRRNIKQIAERLPE